jgi:hypothetical protein
MEPLRLHRFFEPGGRREWRDATAMPRRRGKVRAFVD